MILETYFTRDHHPFLKPNHAASCSSFFFFFFPTFQLILIFKLSLFFYHKEVEFGNGCRLLGRKLHVQDRRIMYIFGLSKIQSTKPKMVLSSFPGARESFSMTFHVHEERILQKILIEIITTAIISNNVKKNIGKEKIGVRELGTARVTSVHGGGGFLFF